ncbi:putative transporter YutK [Haemaphysalis longicornis]
MTSRDVVDEHASDTRPSIYTESLQPSETGEYVYSRPSVSRHDSRYIIYSSKRRPTATTLSEGLALVNLAAERGLCATTTEDEQGWCPDFLASTKGLALLAFHVYLVVAIVQSWSSLGEQCNSVGALITLTVLGYALAAYRGAVYVVRRLAAGQDSPRRAWISSVPFLNQAVLPFCIVALFVLLALSAWHDTLKLRSLVGYLLIICTAVGLSRDRNHINWTNLQVGVMAHLVTTVVTTQWAPAVKALSCFFSSLFVLRDLGNEGFDFLFGHLATGINMSRVLGEPAAAVGIRDVAPVYIFSVVPSIFVAAFAIGVLYYYGIVQSIIIFFEELPLFGASTCQALGVLLNVPFHMILPLMALEPYLKCMTLSEIHCLITSGLASVSSLNMPYYATKHRVGVMDILISATVMSVPGTLLLAKVVYPEVQDLKPKGTYTITRSEGSLLIACTKSVSKSTVTVANIFLVLLNCLGLIALTDAFVVWIFDNLRIRDFTLVKLASLFLFPFCYMIGVPLDHCTTVAQVVAVKLIGDEAAAFVKLDQTWERLEGRSQVLAAYAVAGFSNMGSVSVVVGGLRSLCKDRAHELYYLVLQALLTSSAVAALSACAAGVLVV